MFGKNLSVNLLSNLWQTLLLLILTPVYVKLLGIESYGLIGFYTSWVAIIAIIDTGISATMIREIAWRSARSEENDSIPNLVKTLEWSYWGIILFFGFISFIMAWVYGGSWFNDSSLSSETIRDALLLMSIALVAQVPSGFYASGLIGLQQQSISATILALFGTVRGVGAVVVLVSISSDIRLFFVWQIVISLFQTIAMRYFMYSKINTSSLVARFSYKMLHDVKEFAGKMVLITILGILVSQMDKMVLSRMVSMEMLGYYMLAWTVASGLMRVTTPLLQVISPYLTETVSKGDSKELERKISFSSQLMTSMIVPPTVLIILFSEPIVLLWIGDSLIAASVGNVLPYITVGTLMASVAYIPLSVLYSKGMLDEVLKINFISSLILLGCLYFAIMEYGIVGAAICWAGYCIALYFAYHLVEKAEKTLLQVFYFIAHDFVIPLSVVFVVTVIGWYIIDYLIIDSKITLVVMLTVLLGISWATVLIISQDLRKIIFRKIYEYK